MRIVLPLIILIIIGSPIHGQEISSYDFDMNINVLSKKIHVKCTVEIDFNDKDNIIFVLWKNTKIHSISCKQEDIYYFFDTLSPSPVMFIPNGGSLNIKKPEGNEEKQTILFEYECDMKELSGWAKAFSEEWIELNLYSGWYPVCWDSRRFTSSIKLTIDDDYKITGSGIVSRKTEHWEMIQPWRSSDNVIIASKKLNSKIFNEDKIYIEIVYSEFSDAEADSVLIECKYISKLYQRFYGNTDSIYLKFVIIPYMQGGYGRENFATLRTKQFDNYTRGGIAHEMAHFWWSNADSKTWEDWLNEAFAEYSMLLYFRDRLGMEEFNSKIELYQSRVQNTPPIWGTERDGPYAYTVLYEKGALLLYELELRLGQDQFMNFLRLILDHKIKTTDELLKLVENELSKGEREWLEKQLRL